MAAQRMTKTQLQSTLAEETGTDRKTAGTLLTKLVEIAYRETKKKGEFVLPGIGKLVKQKRKARTGINPKTGEKLKIAAKTVVKLRVAKAAKDAVLGEAPSAPAPAAAKGGAAKAKAAAPAAKKAAAAPAKPAKKAAPAAAAKKARR
ncbi:HU family DNA-binding protein [Verrucomicrobiota bacterium sgz303538]